MSHCMQVCSFPHWTQVKGEVSNFSSRKKQEEDNNKNMGNLFILYSLESLEILKLSGERLVGCTNDSHDGCSTVQAQRALGFTNGPQLCFCDKLFQSVCVNCFNLFQYIEKNLPFKMHLTSHKI